MGPWILFLTDRIKHRTIAEYSKAATRGSERNSDNSDISCSCVLEVLPGAADRLFHQEETAQANSWILPISNNSNCSSLAVYSCMIEVLNGAVEFLPH